VRDYIPYVWNFSQYIKEGFKMKVKVTITCSECHHTFGYDGSFELKSIEEREMGKEFWYEDSYVDTQCPKCNCDIKGSISYWEYPEEALNTYDSDLTNAKAKVVQM